MGSVTSEQSRTTSPLACTQIPKEAAAFATVCRPRTTGNPFPPSSPNTNHLLRMSSLAPVPQADDPDLFTTSCDESDEDHEVEVISPTPVTKADAASPLPKVKFNFFDECGVVELAQKIDLDLSGIVKPTQKESKEPITDANNNEKEAIKTAQRPTTSESRKERLLAKMPLLAKENALRRQLLSQHAALARSQHALQLRQQRTKLYTAHKFKRGSILSGNQPFISDAMAEVAARRRQQAFAAESARHLALLACLEHLAPNGKYVNRRPVPAPPPSPKPLPPSNRSLWRQNNHSSWTPVPMPFQLQSLAAPRTKLVHLHHHHYPDDVKYTKDDYTEDGYTEDGYTEDGYTEDDYTEDDYTEDDYIEDDYIEDDYIEDESLEFEYAGVFNSESKHLLITSSDEISDW